METFEQTTQKEIRRPSILLDVRNYQCSFIRPQDEKRFDPFGGGTGNGSNSLHDASGRNGGLPLPFGKAGTRSELQGSDEPDPFADYHNAEPMKFPANCDDIVKQSWYHKGRIDGQREQFEKLMPVIDGMLEGIIR
jgi:hypothetical protein